MTNSKTSQGFLLNQDNWSNKSTDEIDNGRVRMFSRRKQKNFNIKSRKKAHASLPVRRRTKIENKTLKVRSSQDLSMSPLQIMTTVDNIMAVDDLNISADAKTVRMLYFGDLATELDMIDALNDKYKQISNT